MTMLVAGKRYVAISCLILFLSGCAAEEPTFHAKRGRDRCVGIDGYSQSFDGRRTFAWRTDWLKKAKLSLTSSEHSYRALLESADAALDRGRYSVTDKTSTPPSGTKSDYMSLGTYWWPNPAASPGAPYIRKDGIPNPERETDRFDLQRMQAFSTDVQSLALAYYFTEDTRYANHAAMMIRAWFVTAETRMNPHLQFAQSVPGVTTGRGTGIIDTLRLLGVIEAIGLLEPAMALSDAELSTIKQWFREYSHWMTTSTNGQNEQKETNNHGSWYDVQLITFALFYDDFGLAKDIARKSGAVRIADQINDDGTLPHEITRTRSFFYSLYGTQALAALATVSECVGVDLWKYEANAGGSLRKSVDFLASYTEREQEWPHPETEIEHDRFYDVLSIAAWAYDDDTLADRAKLKWRYADGAPALLRSPQYSDAQSAD